MKKTLTVLVAVLVFFTAACYSEMPAAVSGELVPGMYTSVGAAGGFTVKGVKMSGTTGTEDGINALPFSLTLIRSVFELDEWITCSIEYEYGTADAKLGIWIFPHRDLSLYGDLPEMREDVFFCEYELPYETYPEPLNDMFTLPASYVKSGDYDMLFTIDGEIIGGILIRMVEKGALDGLTDDEISAFIAAG